MELGRLVDAILGEKNIPISETTQREVMDLLDTLPARYRQVIERVYGVNTGIPMTLRQVAASLPSMNGRPYVSTARVGQMRERALRQLRGGNGWCWRYVGWARVSTNTDVATLRQQKAKEKEVVRQDMEQMLPSWLMERLPARVGNALRRCYYSGDLGKPVIDMTDAEVWSLRSNGLRIHLGVRSIAAFRETIASYRPTVEEGGTTWTRS